MFNFWEYRQGQEEEGKAFGVVPFSTKAYYAGLQGVTAGTVYGIMYWAYYPDKFAFSHKGTVAAGPSRGLLWLQHTMLRPAVAFTAVNMTFAAVESFLEEVKGSHHKDPWNAACAGGAAGFVLGGLMRRRIDIASMTGLGCALLMGMVEFNGSNVVVDPVTENKRKFPTSVESKFSESSELSGLKEKYPAYKYN